MKKQITIFSWAIKLLFKISPVRMVVNILVVALSAVLPVVVAVYTGQALDNVVNQINLNEHISHIISPVVLLGTLFLLDVFLRYGSGIITSALDVKMSTLMNEQLLDIVENVSLKEFDDAEFYNDFTTAQEGFTSILTVTDSLFQLIGEIVSLISTLVVIFSIFPPFLALTVLSFVIGYRINMASKKQQRDYWKETVVERRFANYLAKVMTAREFAKEVRSYNSFPLLFSQWEEIRAGLRKKSFEISKTAGQKFALYQVFMDFVSIVVLIIAVFLARRNVITLGQIIVLWQLSKTALTSVQTLNNAYGEIYFNNEKIEKAKNLIQKYKGFEKQEQEDLKGNEAFRMENVSFTYKNGATVLKNLSLSIEKKQAVAIIGENGSGKSTLAKLLIGLYEPDEGNVYIDGHNSKCVDREYLKKTVGVAFQDFVNYPFTLRENIGYGYIDKIEEDEEIFRAAEKGDAIHLLERAGDLSRVLGRTLEEDGMEMSGGEWQRIALSRAYMGDKPILVFDEPAAKLDPNAELRQFERIREMIADKTALLISHRIGFARLAQRIIVMKNGRIVEDGTHKELLSLKGEYCRLLSEQAQWYDLEWEKAEDEK